MVPEPLKRPRELPAIPGYRIEGIVGRGATGVVYRARQTSVDRVVALKVLHPELVGSASALRRMQREARLTAKLAHPNIISAIDMGDVGGQLWYAMELVDGLSLAERIAERPLSEREALRIFIPLCEALAHAHECGVVHRDIKPANILIERGGRPLLVDLGLAYDEKDPVLTKSGGTLGTPHYISPEQARDPVSADVQSDLWSLGATMYHAVTGRTPFRGESVAEILSSVLYERVPDPREHATDLSNGFVLVLRKCLTRDKGARYRDPTELLADLERLRERRAPKSSAQGLDPLERRALRGPRLVLAIAAGVLLAGGAGTLAWKALRSAEQGAARTPADDALEALARAVDSGPASGLAAALADCERLSASETLGARARERLESVRGRLFGRVLGERQAFQREREAEIAGLLGARDFAAARELSARNPQTELARRIGSRALPAQQAAELEDWQKAELGRVADARAEAEDAFLLAIDRHVSEVLLPRCDELEHQGDWKAARELVAAAPERLLETSGVETRGLEPRLIERGREALRTRADARRKALDASWAATDQELVAWVEARAAELERELEQRRSSAAPAVLAREFAAELARRGTSAERMPIGLPHYSLEAAVEKGRELELRENQLSELDSARLLEELEEQAQPAWAERRYEDVEKLFLAQPEGLLRGASRLRAAQRQREAHLLAGLLHQAAEALVRRNGQKLELRVGTVPITGTLEVPADPLRDGFRLRPEGAAARLLALRAASAPGSSQVLSTESLAALAGLAPESALQDKDLRLVRALFLFRESEASGDAALLANVRALLDRGPLPADDPLVSDLGLRLAEAQGRRADLADRERREKARARLFALRRSVQQSGDARTIQALAEELLKDPAPWTEDELIELRGIRDAQSARLAQGPLALLERALGPSALVELAGGRVRLSFEVARLRQSAFVPGSWILSGPGWAPARAARSDEDFLQRASPALPLDALRTDREALDLQLVLEQPEDQPPVLFSASAAGLHVAFLGAREGQSARWLVDTLSAEHALERLRAGEGREFAGWKAGTRVELHLVLHRARGTVLAELGKQRLGNVSVPPPRSEGGAELVLRSWECLRLVALTLEAERR